MNITELIAAAARRKDKPGFISEILKANADVDTNDQAQMDNIEALYYRMIKDPTGAGTDTEFNRRLFGPSRVGSGGFFSQMRATQYHPSTKDLPEFGTMETLPNVKDLIQVFKNPLVGLSKLGATLGDEVQLYLLNSNRLFQEINEKAAMTGEFAEAFRNEIMDASKWGIKLGIGFDELAKSVGDLVAQSGKFKLINEETLKEMALASKFVGSMQDLAKMGRGFELVGLGLRDMSKYVQETQIRSQAVGLNARAVLAATDEHLKKINTYGFKNGIEGMRTMAMKSLEFRTNMSEVFKLAEQVWEPDKALELVANLQVIGGAVGALNDPLKLMYMATNDVEGLQDALIESTKAFATFNDEQGRFEITGVNLRRAREAAKILGMDYDELANSAIAAMEREQAVIDMAGKGLDIKEKDREFIINLARMEGGQMIIDIPKDLRKQLQMLPDQTSIALSDLTDQNIETIVKQRELLEEMKPEDVARQQVMLIENIQRDLSFIRAAVRVSVGQNAADLMEQALGLRGESLADLSNSIANMVNKGIDKADKNVGEFIKQMPEIIDIGKYAEDLASSLDGVDETLQENTKATKQKAQLETEAKNVEVEKVTGKKISSEDIATKEQTMTVTHNVNLNPMDGTMDRIAQIFMGDRRFADEWANSFLNPNSN